MLLSGSGLSSWALQKNPLSTFKQLAIALNCSFDSPNLPPKRSYGGYDNISNNQNRNNNNNNNLKQNHTFGSSETATHLNNATKPHSTNSKSDNPLFLRATRKPTLDTQAFKSSNLKALQCVRSKKFEEILSVQLTWPKYRVGFGPTIDRKTILPFSLKKLTLSNCPKYRQRHERLKQYFSNTFPNDDLPAENKEEGNFGDIPLFIGGVATAGSDYLSQEDLQKPISNLRSAQVLRTFVRNNYRYHRQKIYDILAHNYYDWDRPNNSKASLKSLVDLITDGVLSAPAVKLAELHAQCAANTHTFFYSLGSTGLESRSEVVFQHSNSFKPLKAHKISKTPQAQRPTNYNHISFASSKTNSSAFFPEGLSSEMAYFLGAPLVNGLDPFLKDFSASERTVSEYLLKYVFNFVYYG